MDSTKQQVFLHQLEAMNGIGEELLAKVEFEFLVDYFFEQEVLIGLVVGLMDEKITLVVLTNQRLFFVKKNQLNLHPLERFGLEEVINLELRPEFGQTSLVISFLNGQKTKLTSLSETKAKRFGKLLIRELKNWNQGQKIV